MDELAEAQRGIARKDFLGGLLRRLALCALLFLPLALLFEIVNPKNSLAMTATYTAGLLALIFVLSAAFDLLEFVLTSSRIARPAPAGLGDKICYAVCFERDGRGFKKRHGQLLRQGADISFWDAQTRSATALGEARAIEAFESGKFYLRDPYSWKKRKMRPLIEVVAEGTNRVFDVMVPARVIEALASGRT